MHEYEFVDESDPEESIEKNWPRIYKPRAKSTKKNEISDIHYALMYASDIKPKHDKIKDETLLLKKEMKNLYQTADSLYLLFYKNLPDFTVANLKLVKSTYYKCIQVERESILVYNRCIDLKNYSYNIEKSNRLTEKTEMTLKLLTKNILALNSTFRMERKRKLQEAFKRLKDILSTADKKVPEITTKMNDLDDSMKPFKDIYSSVSPPVDVHVSPLDDNCILSLDDSESIFPSSESSAISSDFTSKCMDFFKDNSEFSFDDFL